MKRIVAITGGIGAGKSVVSRALRSMGYPVYDCDSEAKALMDSDAEMRREIGRRISPEALNADGTLNRRKLAEAVFGDSGKLTALNSIVHGAVRAHFLQWVERRTAPTVFVETAILYESGFDSLVGEVWEVTAPKEVRIARVCSRNGLERDAVEKRIASQSSESRPHHKLIVNDGNRPVITQILQLLGNDR